MYLDDWEICDCDCHKWPDLVSHIAPCCHTCRICGAHVNFGFEESHREKCKEPTAMSGILSVLRKIFG